MIVQYYKHSAIPIVTFNIEKIKFTRNKNLNYLETTKFYFLVYGKSLSVLTGFIDNKPHTMSEIHRQSVAVHLVQKKKYQSRIIYSLKNPCRP